MAIGGLVVLALTAALVVPYFVDWSNYRADFEREASRVLGRDVEVRGPATARLLPFPSVTFSDVVVIDAGGEVAMTVDTFSMDVELTPFLSGEILIFDMRLERPRAVLTVGDDGTLDWAMRPSAPIQAGHVTLENVTVTEGHVEIRHRASGRQHVLSGLEATLSARALAGPWRAQGEVEVDGLLTAFTVSTGTADSQTGALRVRLRAEPLELPLAIEAEGEARLADGGTISYGGQFRLTGHATAPAGDDRAEAAARRAPDYRLSGTFSMDHERLSADEFRFETGPLEDPYTAEGSAMIAIGAEPHFRVSAEGVQLRFEEAEGGAARLEERLEGLRRFVSAIPRPGMPGSVEIDLPAIIAGDTTIRDVRLSASPSDVGWNIASLAATLPGRSTLEASGELVAGAEIGFTGSLLLAINQPSGFAAWLSRDVDEAIRRLPAAGFSAEVEIGRGRQTFRDLELALGGSVFRGLVDNRQPEGQRPSMSLSLRGEGLDVEGLAAFASLFVSDGGRNRLEDHDLDFDILAGDVRLGGVTADSIDTALRLRDGRLEIDRLMISGLAGANISAAGAIRDLSGRPTGNLDASVIAHDLAPLLGLAAERLPDELLLTRLAQRARDHHGLLRDARLDFSFNGSAGRDGVNDVHLQAAGHAGGNSYSFRVASSDWRGRPELSPLSASLDVESEELTSLLALLGLPGLDGVGIGSSGPAEARMTLDGVVRNGAEIRATLSNAGTRARFAGHVQGAAQGYETRGSLTLTSADLTPWLLAAGVVLPGTEFGLPVDLVTEIDHSGGMVVMTGLDGTVAGSRVKADLNGQLRDGVPHVTGEVALDAFDLALAAEAVLGPEALQTTGSYWPDRPISRTANIPLTAELDISLASARLGEAPELAEARSILRLSREGIAISDLSAEVLGGTLSGLGELRNDGGSALVSAQLRLEDADATQLLGDAGMGGRAQLSATLSSTGETVATLFSRLSGSGTGHARGLVLSGLAPDALPAILDASDRLEGEINVDAVEAFAPGLVRAGSFAARDFEFAFTVAAGTLRAPPVQMEADGARLVAEPRLDLGTMTIAVDATLQFDAGGEGLVGSDPSLRVSAEGPHGDVVASIDVEPLARFLSQRALEREQRRVEDMQASLLEQQRLRREVRYFDALRQERLEREEEQRRAEAEARLAVNEERRRRAEAEAARRAEVERMLAEQEARRSAEEEERLRALEEATIRAEQERRRVEEERRRAEEARIAAAEKQAFEEDAQSANAERIALLKVLRAADLEAAELDRERRIAAEAAAQAGIAGQRAILEAMRLADEEAVRLDDERRKAFEAVAQAEAAERVAIGEIMRAADIEAARRAEVAARQRLERLEREQLAQDENLFRLLIADVMREADRQSARLGEERRIIAEAEEAARLERERAEAEEAARLERERAEAEEAARLERERAEAEEAARLERERAEAEEAARLERERAEEAARLAEQERRRLERERQDAETGSGETAAPSVPGPATEGEDHSRVDVPRIDWVDTRDVAPTAPIIADDLFRERWRASSGAD